MATLGSKSSMHKVAVLGEGGVGKTSLTIQFIKQHFVETYDPTLEDSYRRNCVIDKVPCMLEVLDTAGQEEFTALREQWIRDSEVFVIVYSVTNRPSFEVVQKLFEQVLSTKTRHDSSFDASLVILVGNKSDLKDQRVVGINEGRMLAKKLGCPFLETSAKARTNVDEAFYELVRADRRHKQEIEDRRRQELGQPALDETLGGKPKKALWRRILHRS